MNNTNNHKLKFKSTLEAKQNVAHPSIWTKDFTFIFVANMFLQLGINMTYSLLPLWAETLGANTAQVGFICSIFALSAFLFKFIAAPMIDSLDKRFVLMFAIFLLTCSFAGYGMSPNCLALSFANFIRGAGIAFGTTTALVIATHALPQDKTAEGIGLFSLSQVLCSAIGPFFSLNMCSAIGFKVTFYISAAIEILAILFVLQLKKDTARKRFHFSFQSVISKKVIPVGIFAFLLACPYATLQSFVVLYGIEQGVAQEYAGLFFTLYAVSLFAARPLCGKAADRIGCTKIIVPSACVYCITFILLAHTMDATFYLLSAFFAALGYGVCQSLFQALAMKLSDSEHRGAASCTYYYGVDGGFFFGPAIAGVLVHLFGYQLMWYMMIIPILLCIITVLFFRKKCQ